MIGDARELLQYEVWALRRTLTAIEALDPPNARALLLFAHILNAYQIWLDRMQGQEMSVGPWQDRTIDDCRETLARLEREYAAFIEDLDARADDPVGYRTTGGKAFSNTVSEVLRQVVLHSPYHRGQINLIIRDAGGEPAVIDYIFYKRD